MSFSRRHFIRNISGLIGASAVFSVVGNSAFGEERRASKPKAGGDPALDLPMVQPGVGSATALNYVLDHKDLKDAKLKVERNGVPFEKQHCNSCMFYTKAGEKGGGEVGKCQLFPNQIVKGSAFCTSWTKKA